jgi:hypothetical protein
MKYILENVRDWNENMVRVSNKRLHAVTNDTPTDVVVSLERDVIRYGSNVAQLNSQIRAHG